MPRKRRHSEFDDTDEDDLLPEDARHPQRNAANARERARMRVLSKAFCRLKTTLPWVPADTKLSKLDTLRLATSYIAHLRSVLMDQTANEIDQQYTKHPLTLTWPFSFQRPIGDSSAITVGHINENYDKRPLNLEDMNHFHQNSHSIEQNHHPIIWGDVTINNNNSSISNSSTNSRNNIHDGDEDVIRDKDVSYYY